MMANISKEDYVKEIYHLSCESNELVSTAYLADKLAVSNAASTDMVKRLDSQGLLNYERYKGVELTDQGEILALKMVRRHRLWETFLINTLGLSWSEVHEEAEVLEHQTSDFLVDKIDEFLGYPKFDPHGDPIPSKDGTLPEMPNLISLSDAVIGDVYKVKRVDHSNKELMEYLTSVGIELEKEINVINILGFDNSIIIKIDETQHSFSSQVASRLYVMKL